jgi:Na+/H+ antiporter NhaD/arsenite permease-like protein
MSSLVRAAADRPDRGQPSAATPGGPSRRPDLIRAAPWVAGITLAILALAVTPGAAADAARATIGPFATLAAIILSSVLADRLGAFAVLERLGIPACLPRTASAVAILVFTALISALVNLDVAVVVAVPVALRASQRHGLAPGRLAISAALTANAASFLLPTSNITNLLLLGREHLPATAYIADSWLPWLLVTVVTVGPLGVWSAAARGHARPVDASLSAGMLADLLALFLVASGVRALLGTALALHGNFAGQLAYGSVIAAVAGNLPAAAAMLPAGTAGLWAAVLAATIGPNLLITGSVATLISRRIAAGGGARLSAWQFSAIGLLLVPAQFAVAALGLHIAGVLQ